MKQVQFSAGRDCKWPDRCRQACKTAALCRGGESEISQLETFQKAGLSGDKEGDNRMSEEAGDEYEGERELAPPHWRVKAGSLNRPTQKNRK